MKIPSPKVNNSKCYLHVYVVLAVAVKTKDNSTLLDDIMEF